MWDDDDVMGDRGWGGRSHGQAQERKKRRSWSRGLWEGCRKGELVGLGARGRGGAEGWGRGAGLGVEREEMEPRRQCI